MVKVKLIFGILHAKNTIFKMNHTEKQSKNVSKINAQQTSNEKKRRQIKKNTYCHTNEQTWNKCQLRNENTE